LDSTEFKFPYSELSETLNEHTHSETWFICVGFRNCHSTAFQSPHALAISSTCLRFNCIQALILETFRSTHAPFTLWHMVHMPQTRLDFETAIRRHSGSIYALTFNKIWDSSDHSDPCSYSPTAPTYPSIASLPAWCKCQSWQPFPPCARNALIDNVSTIFRNDISLSCLDLYKSLMFPCWHLDCICAS
jgi:hypothetical protein